MTPKYVEVPGPNGIVRLSPEVAARNKAAAEEYQRKLKAHADAIAQTRARNERSAAQHAAALARHAEAVAKAASEKREYERQLANNAAEVAAYKMQTSKAAGDGRTFQATGAIRATRDEAMASLMGQNLPSISNVQCKEVTSYDPARWTCWGTYQQTATRGSSSKQ